MISSEKNSRQKQDSEKLTGYLDVGFKLKNSGKNTGNMYIVILKEKLGIS